MNSIIKKTLVAAGTGVGALATVAAMSSPASAATVDVNFEGNGIDFTAVQAGQTLSCPQFDLAGTYDDVTGSGVLDDLTASGCTNPIAGSTSVVPNGIWSFNGDSSGAATISDITATVTAAGCVFDVAGDVEGTFNEGSQTFEVGTSNVKISNNPSGFLCPILGVAQGQDIEIDGSWTNTGGTIVLP